MADDDHLAQLMKGVAAWNAWRNENPDIRLDLSEADLNRANLYGADLSEANLRGANLSNADLRVANLWGAQLVDTDLTDADLTGCHIYGISAWSLKLERAKQQNLVITRADEPEITVDNIEVA